MSEVKWWQKQIEKKWVRAIALVVCAVVGWVLLKCNVPAFLIPEQYHVDGKVPALFSQVIATTLIFFVLWFFRTYDARQAIEKTETQNKELKNQVNQSNFDNGLDKLGNDKIPTIENGLKILLKLSKTTDEFDDQIQLAFAKRLERLPEGIHPDSDNCVSINAKTASYIRGMLWWLYKYKGSRSDVVIRPSFRYRELLHRTGVVERAHETDDGFYLCSISLDELKSVLAATKSSDVIWL